MTDGPPAAPSAGSPTAPSAGSPTAPSAGSPTAPSAGSPTAPSAGSPTAPSADSPTAPSADPSRASVAVSVSGVHGIPEVSAGDDLAALIFAAADDLRDGDIIVVTSKIVSKAEGRVMHAVVRDDAIAAETVRVVARRGDTTIAQTRHGLVLAAAGVDASNTPAGTVVLLPADPDESARRLRKTLRDRSGKNIGVIITDTMGRPWRAGQTDTAIGAAGVRVLRDYRGAADTFGNVLEVTVTAVADELAAAGDLVKGKTLQVPVAVVRGRGDLVLDEDTDEPGANALIRPAAEDMFRLGAADVIMARRDVRSFSPRPVDPAAISRGVAAALTAPVPSDPSAGLSAIADAAADAHADADSDADAHAAPGAGADAAPGAGAAEPGPCRFAVVTSAGGRAALLDSIYAGWAADLRRDGLPPAQIAASLSRDTPLRTAPVFVLCCLLAPGAAAHASRERLVAALGAAVENLLIALAVDGLGSTYIAPPASWQDGIATALDLPADWQLMAVVAAGHPADPVPARHWPDPSPFIVTR